MKHNMKEWFAAGCICAGLALIESAREQMHFKVTQYRIQTTKMSSRAKPLRIVFLSDLHNHEYGKKNVRLLQAVKDADPDLILIGGDMLIGKPGRLPKPALHFVRQLPAIAPVYYANGNHEQRIKENPGKYGKWFYRYRRQLQGVGVHFLENESELLHYEGMDLCLTGLEMPMETYDKFRCYKIDAEDVARQVGKVPKNCYNILLAHNPTYADAYKSWGADLVLSGHLHGGMVRIPGWRGLITPQGFLFPKYSGEMKKENGRAVIVSRGLGTHTINFRLFNVPELVLLEIE